MNIFKLYNFMKKTAYELELNRQLFKVKGKPLDSTEEALDVYKSICCGCVVVAEECLKNQNGEWKIAQMAKTLLHYAAWLEQFDHMLDFAHKAVSRMANSVYEHPRLKLKLLELKLTILQRIEAQADHDLSITEDVVNKIILYRRNIAYADKGELDKIEKEGHLKHDPIEWTAQWEDIIDEADKKTFRRLRGHPRGMGFCFAYWHERREVLNTYGIDWKSPSVMNPSVLFD